MTLNSNEIRRKMNKLLLTPYEGYFGSIAELLSRIFRVKENKVCYISLNKTYSHLKSSLTSAQFDRIFVIDAASKATGTHEGRLKDTKECVYITPHDLIKELISVQKKFLDTGTFNNIIFDSLSTLLVYNTEKEVTDYFIRFSSDMSICSDVYFLCNKVDLPAIAKNFEEREVLMIQELDNEFLIKSRADLILEVWQELEQAIENNNKSKADQLYKKARLLYKKLKANECSAYAKKQVYNKLFDCYNRIKLL